MPLVLLFQLKITKWKISEKEQDIPNSPKKKSAVDILEDVNIVEQVGYMDPGATCISGQGEAFLTLGIETDTILQAKYQWWKIPLIPDLNLKKKWICSNRLGQNIEGSTDT